MFADGGVLRDSGSSSGSPGPSTSTSYNTNIPEYAKPYVENMLNAAQAQIYTPDMTGFNPYKPYSTNPQDYVAGVSPMQQQAYSSAANMQVPGQYGAATGITGLGIGASYGLAGQEAQAGNRLAQMSTNPNAVGAYMNPYIQNALVPAQQLLNQQYGIQGAAQQGQATSSGAFGGTRNALQQNLNEQNRMLAQNQLVGNAYQQAFGQAQGQMNQVANVGLQGQQAAMQGIGQTLQGGSQLANIGGQTLNAQQGIANLQNTYGSQQQAQQQQVINQAIQNYATEQQYPYMQLGILNSMLRGLPMQSTTTASYQAQPSTAMQAAGLLGAAGSLYGGGKKEGGIIGMKAGGAVPGYRYGSVINEPQLESMANRMDDKQLNTVKGLPGITPDERNTFDSALINNNYVRSNPQAAQMLSQAAPPPQQPAPTDRMSGIAQAGGGMFNTMGNGMAGGGIVAFGGGDLIEQQRLQAEKDAAEQDANRPAKAAEKAIIKDTRKEQTRADFLKEQQDMLRSMGVNPDAVGEKGKAYQAQLEAQQAGIGSKEDQLERMAKAKAFLSLTQPTGGKNALGQAGSALEQYLGEKATNIKTIDDLKNVTAKAQAELEAGNRARAAGDIEAASKHFDKARELQNQLQIAQGNNAATLGAAKIHSEAAGKTQALEEKKVDEYMKDHPGATRSEAYAAVAQYSRGESNEITRLKAAIELKQKQLYGPGTAEEKAKIQQDIATLTQQLLQSGTKPPTPGPVPTEVTVGGKTYNRKDYPQMTDAQWSDYVRQNKG